MEENKFKCNICNKYYKSYKSLWNHKKKYHEDIPTNIPNISPLYPQNIPNISPEYPHNSINYNSNSQPIIKQTEKRNCDYCNKILSSYKNLHRHLQTCKLKKQEQTTAEMKKEISELREMVAELIKNKSNTNNNNTNNGTING